MKPRMFTVMAILLSMSLTAGAQAVDRPAPAAPSEAIPSVKVPGKVGYKLSPAEFSDYEYTYILTTGEKIVFSRRINHYYGRLSGKNGVGPTLELSPLQPGMFATANGAQIEFKDAGEEVIVSSPELMRAPLTASR